MREGIEHLQAAGLEVLAAVRSFLDLAEDAVNDPTQAAAYLGAIADSARRAGQDEADPPAGSSESAITRIRIT